MVNHGKKSMSIYPRFDATKHVKDMDGSKYASFKLVCDKESGDTLKVHSDGAGNYYVEKYKEETMSVKLYRKKPTIVEAIQYDGTNYHEIRWWLIEHGGHAHDCYEMTVTSSPEIWFRVQTAEGDVIVTPSDWVIKDTAGEFHSRQDVVFKAIYEEEK